MRTSLRVLSILVVVFFLAGISTTTFASVHTTAVPKVRVTQKVDNSKRATLYGHVPLAVRTATDLGRQEPNTPSPGMIMVLKSSEEQKHEIRRVIDEQQDKRTANYHQWVTPEEFGENFGVHEADIAQITDWLRSQGFMVDEVSKSKRVIKFSGNIGQVEQAFQTEMHLYNHNGEMHVSNDREISVPEAFKKVIAGVTLHNFYRKANFDLQDRIRQGGRLKLDPKFTSSTSVHYVAPADFQTIYNTAPLIAAGYNGTGSSIAIVGRSDIQKGDVAAFRQLMNLPANDPVFIHAGQDNGQEPGDDGESDLDVEQSGAVAPEAQINFVIGTPAFLVDGITNSIQYIVDNNVADIMSISYGDCEGNEGVGGNEFNNQAFEQAAAQGISVFIASGDNGPAGCDDQNDSYEVLGYAAGGEASTPYSIAAGGTEFYGECATPGPSCTQSNYSKYWSATTNPFYLNSALGYIPEYPWNDAKASTKTAVPSGDLSGLWSSSGGISAYYLRPSWQTSPDPASMISSANSLVDPSIAQGGNWIQVHITNAGSGYTTGPTVTFAGETCATNPTTTLASTIVSGAVTAINYNYGTQGGTLHVGQGIGCTVAGTVTFTAAPAGGTTATGTAVLVPMQILPELVTGVGHRLTPDLALNASADQDGTIICSEGLCTDGYLGIEGGTSVAAPSMAGIQALVNNYMAVNHPESGNPSGRQGMPGYVYYQLAAAQYTNNGNSYTACDSDLMIPPYPVPTAPCAFQDIQTGNTLICGTSTCTSTSGTKIGFSAGAGYDLTTGLGSVNAYNLATQWNSVTGSFASTTTTLNAPVVVGTAITLSGTIAYTSATPPSGDVSFIFNQGGVGDPVNPSSSAFVNPGAFATIGSVTAPNNSCSPPAGSVCFSATLNNVSGTYNPATLNVTARYGGDNINASSYSSAQPLAVNTDSSTVTITPGYINGSACTLNFTSTFTYGANIWTTVNVASSSGSGVPTGTVTITNTNPAWDGGNGLGVAYTLASNIALDPQGNAYLATGAIASSSCVYDYTFAQAPALPGGSNTISATYSGDSTFTAPGSPTTAGVTVTQIATTPTLAAGATAINAGFADTLTATFAANSAVTSNTFNRPPGISGPTGTVQFYDGVTLLGSATAVPQVIFTSNDTSSSSLPSWTYTATAVLTTTGITTTGANSITAKYLGDTNYAPETSTAVTVTVGTDTATSIALTTANNPTTLRGEPTFTATVTGLTGATAGTVTFYDATYGVVLGTGSVSTTSTKTASLKLGATPAFVGGTHNINATYGGSSTFAASSTTTPLVETVTQGTMTILLSGKQVGKSGQNYSFQALLNCTTPTASGGCATNAEGLENFPTVYSPILSNVNFYDGATLIGSASALPSTITYAQGGYGVWLVDFTASSLAPGSHTITATYTDTNWAPATSNAMTVFVAGTPTITWPTPSAITYPAALSATQLNATDSIPYGTFVYTPGSGTVLTPGLHTLSVTFTPADTTDFGPQTKTVSLTVNPGPTSINVTNVSPSNEDYGADTPVTITAVLSWTGSGAAPTASDVTIGGNGPSSYGTTSCGVPSGNTITCTNTYTPTVADGQGTYNETATFSGDSNYSSSSSPQTGNFTINQASAATVITAVPNPSAFGQSVTFTATITGENNLVRGQSKPKGNNKKPLDVSGSVLWSVDTGCGTTPVTTGNPGVATCTTSSLPEGTDVITGTYSGDSNHGGSTGTLAGGEVVQGATVTINVTHVSPSSEYYGANALVTITAVLSWTGNGTAPTASDITIGGNGPSSYGTTSCGAPSSHTITCTNTYTPTGADGVGSYNETASFSGDTNYNSASSPQTGNFTILALVQAITFTTPAPPTAEFLGSFTVAATGGGSGNPVVFSVGAGSVCTLSSATYTMTNKVGNCYVVANQAGNATYAAATQVTETVAAKAGAPVRIAPTVTFTGAPSSAPYQSTFTVATTQNSGVTPTFSVTTASACSIAGNVVTMKTGNETCTVKASWAQNTYYTATTATQSTSATPLATTTTITGTVPKANNSLNVVVSFTVSDGSALTGSTLVTVTSAAGPSCTGTLTAGSCTLRFVGLETTTVTASFPGTGNYTGSTSASFPLTVN
jgi:hypothetical protein